MTRRSLRVFAPVAFAVGAVAADAADRVRLVDGATVSGTVVKATRETLRVETVDGVIDVETARLKALVLDEEPAILTQARIHAASGGYKSALERLAEVQPASLGRDLARQEAAFLGAISAARLAERGDGDVRQAGEGLAAFLRDHPQSVHYYAAAEALGDLLASRGRHEQADRFYGLLADSPGSITKGRATLLAGRSLQRQGRHDEAIERFAALLASPPAGEAAEPLLAEAAQSKAVSLAASGRIDEALAAVRDLAARAGDEDDAALAAAYNTLGRCYEAAERPRDALYAYLHTDLLFSGESAAHAEALGRLAELWGEAGKPDAARDARDRLRRRYAGSAAARRAD